jgi:hypothetical protein
VAKTLADTYALEQWQQRMIANGLGRKPELYQLAVAHPDPEAARGVYDEIVTGAMEASDGAAGRRLGTALHALTERLDLDLLDRSKLDADMNRRLELYAGELQRCGVQVHPQWIEQIVVLDFDTPGSWRIAGTVDRIVTLADGRRVIADLKTGKSVDHGALDWAIQLAIYANHSATVEISRTGTVSRGPRIDVEADAGLIIHLPSRGEPQCKLWTIDLKVGYAGLITSMEARELRTTKDILTAYRPSNGGTGGSGALRDWLAGRIKDIMLDPVATDVLVAAWPAGLGPPLPSTLTVEDVARFDAVLSHVEDVRGLPFGPPRPGTIPPKKAR